MGEYYGQSRRISPIFKAKLDEWNNGIDELEAQAREMQGDVQAQFNKQLEALREMRDDALKRQNEMQSAAVDAWDTMV